MAKTVSITMEWTQTKTIKMRVPSDATEDDFDNISWAHAHQLRDMDYNDDFPIPLDDDGECVALDVPESEEWMRIKEIING